MKHLIAVGGLAALSLAVCAPAGAQADLQTDPQIEEQEAPNLMEEGARLFMRGLMSEMAPALDDLEAFADDMAPRLRLFAQEMGDGLADVVRRIDDINHYEAPEILDNGDILIRRSPDAPPWEPPEEEMAPGGEIDL